MLQEEERRRGDVVDGRWEGVPDEEENRAVWRVANHPTRRTDRESKNRGERNVVRPCV